MSIRPIKRVIKAKPAIEGAGVHLRRAFGFGNTSEFDPFLLLDDFRNDIPEDYLAGFPWHPHRGIETITYVLAGTVEHGDSMGNRGIIGPGDIQWMTAGRGIIHQEMPKGDPLGQMHGFQLWANLPASLKMTPPRYQEVKSAEIPVITDDDGPRVRVVCGTFWGKKRPRGRDRGRPGLPGRLGAAGKNQNAACGDDAARFRVRLCRDGKILQRVGAFDRADGGSGLGGCDAAHQGGKPGAYSL